MEFTTGPSPQPGKGTFIKLSSASKMQTFDTWGIKIESVMGNRVTVGIETSAEAIVGEWKMEASVNYKKRQENNRSVRKETYLYMLFNPWDKGDVVFFPDKTMLSEYILNDSGCIFTGGYDQIAAKPWFYGQFESGILEAAILCMNKAFKSRPRRAMGDPVRVSRAISKIVNSNDDKGVITGSWSGNYRNGTAPLAWVGSVSILRQYMKSKMPVKYGQCFVFAGVVTTLCRALGIPCRTVTNFSSAHDTDGSVTVDVHWDALGNSELTSLNTDSIWNFHVWNDAWMKRKDLPPGNDGWQVLDSTPQETSDGEFRCGPAPLTAVLNGKCDMNYDTAFIYAEVNADRVHWSKQDDGNWQMINIDKAIVGKMISTKKPDGLPLPDNFDDCEKFRDDITSQYKYLEGSERERMSVISAALSAPRGLDRVYTKDSDIKFEILTPKSVMVGSDFEIVIEFSNSAGVSRTLSGRILCEVTKYTGTVVRTCKKEALNVEIEAYQQQRVVMHVAVEEYVDAVAEAAMFRFAMITRVKESGQQFAAVNTFRLRLPDLSVKIRDRFLRAGVPVDITVCFDNPLKTRTLSNCLILAECPGMKHMKVFSTRNVLPGEQFQTTIQITPDTRGTCPLFLTFNCDQIHDIKGTCTLYIQ
ncbi:hemocyte protein-glutamine gamma-glutamyltransferase-like [Mercenaria mercenaria]|uniref:hemocyte protein-glutamine gamma-glutamyltransferase-like n=1 Tax=Mercenaria mercenaria TaxID=6596 RepID=UPI00234E8BB9|nr:hemocyte protein-glutamine gamma-glutamyltransferase-like [Mercenaria mercenaria]